MLLDHPLVRRRAPQVAAVGAVALALGLSACGSSGSSTSTNGANAGGNGRPGFRGGGGFMDAKVRACLTKQGVTLPSRPAGGNGTPPNGGNGAPPGGGQGYGTPPNGGGAPPNGGQGYGGNGTPPNGGQGYGGNGTPPNGGRPGGGFRGGMSAAQRKKFQAALKACGVSFQRPPGGAGRGAPNGAAPSGGPSTTTTKS